MNEVHSIPLIYPIHMPNKFVRDRNKQQIKKKQSRDEKVNDKESQLDESEIQHIDEIV